MNPKLILPISSLLEFIGVITLITNESIIGPIDIGFSIPYLISADVQGFGLFLIGGLLSVYAITQMNR